MPPVKRPPRERRQVFFREWRMKKGLKQYQAAERLDIEPSTLSRLESGESPYDQDILERLALLYMCEPSDLLSVNPLEADDLEGVMAMLRKADPGKRRQAQAIVEALLKSA